MACSPSCHTFEKLFDSANYDSHLHRLLKIYQIPHIESLFAQPNTLRSLKYGRKLNANGRDKIAMLCTLPLASDRMYLCREIVK